MSYSTETNTAILYALNRAQTRIANNATEDALYYYEGDDDEGKFLSNIEESQELSDFIFAVDNQYNDWTEAEMNTILEFYDVKYRLQDLAYITRDEYNFNITSTTIEDSITGGSLSGTNLVLSRATLSDIIVDLSPISSDIDSSRQVLTGTGLEGGGNLSADRTISISDGGVDTTQLADGAVTTIKVEDSAITLSKLATNSVNTVRIVDSSITNSKLATNCVSNGKIADGSVTNNKLSVNSVRTTNILNNNITLEKMADNSVDSAQYVDGSIDAVHLADAVAIKITSGTNQLYTKVIQIGDWDMDTDATVNVAHGLSNFKKVRGYDVIIRNDADTAYGSIYAAGNTGGLDSTNIVLTRDTSGIFDSANYNATSYNRGWVKITYES